MQKVIISLMAIVALANAGGIQGSYQSQYVQHSHAAVVAPVVHSQVVHAPVVHSQVVHAPVVHARVVHAPVVHAPVAVANVVPTFYKQAALVPTAYASSYSYRAPAAKVLKTVVQHQPIVYAAPHPIYNTVVPSAYASAYSYRAPAAKLAVPVVHQAVIAHHAVAPAIAVHHASHQVLLH